MIQKKEKNATLPGVLPTIAAGLDLTARHFWLVLIPVLLDTFLWLGPRLSLRPLIEQMVAFWPQDAALAEMTGQLLAVAPRTNLFTSLSVPFLGVPALMTGMTPEKTPLVPEVIELTSPGLWLLLFVGLSLLGLLLAAVYLTIIARVVRGPQQKAGDSPQRFSLALTGRHWLKLLGLVLLFVVAALLVYVPLLVAAFFLALIHASLAAMILLSGPVFILWMIIYLGFAPHGFILNGRPFIYALLESVRLVQKNLLPTLALFLIIAVVGGLLDWLLLAADDGSWLTLGGLVGHAFISTSLIVATFVFYRDRYVTLFRKG